MAFLRGFVRLVRRLAVVAAVGVGAIALLLADEGLTAGEAVLVAVLLAPSAFLLVFAQGVAELASLPDRFRRMPGESQERLVELSRLAGQAGTARTRGVPLALWRLRGTAGSLRDVAGIALPLRVLTPGFLGLAALSALVCAGLVGAGVIALIVLAANS
jgi:hypothetical protein